MIVSFRHKGLRLFSETGSTRGIQAEHSKKLGLILDSLAVASSPEDLAQPYFRLHPLKGERLGFWSIWSMETGVLHFALCRQTSNWSIKRTITEDFPMMRNPCHPGELLKENFGSDGLNISIAEAARRLGISRVTFSRVTNCHAAISADLAVRLQTAGLSTARFWLALQSAYDLSQALKKKQPKIVPFKWEQPKAA